VRNLVFALCFCAPLFSQDLSVVIHDPTGATADTPLSSSYQFTPTAVGGSTQIVLRFTNPTANPVQVAAILVGNASGSSVYSPNFSITGQAIGKTLAAGSANFEDVTVSFTPQTVGALTGYLQATYQIVENGCDPTSQTPATQCPGTTQAVSTLSGNGTAAQLVLSYAGLNGVVTPQANSATPISFGNVSTSATSSLTFTLSNQSNTPIAAPAVSLKTAVFGSSAFVLNTAKLPPTIPAAGSGSFTITFAPGQTQQDNATLYVGNSFFSLTGTGVVIADIDALQISAVDSTGVRTLPQAATPINFGQVVAGTSSSGTLTFTVTNPTTSFNAVTVSTLAVTGAGFALVGAPATPLSIAPGASINFQVAFAPTAQGTFTGTLAIGTRQFSLTGLSTTSAVPQPSFRLSQQPLQSNQQVTLTIQLASASPVSAIGQLAMTFAPTVANVSDDPAVVFLATSGRQLQVNVASGAQTATYNGQSAITFQTGTTAGTITLTLTFPNGAPVTQSFTISPEQVHITTATAVRQSPNLVVTLNGFDNTYSTGKMSFTFFDTSGKQINPTAMSVDATAAFSTYFFTNNQAGGAFSVQASFPVTGDVTQVGSVSVNISNSTGTTSTSQTFQ
jgi:hypothetical protein